MDRPLSAADHATAPSSRRTARIALAAGALAVAVQSVGPVFVRKSGFPGLVFAFHRLWFAAIVYTLVSVARGTPPTWRAVRTSAAGGFWFACNIATFFVAVQHTTVANATVIGALQPVALLLLSHRMFGERIRAADLACTALAIGGVALVVFSHHGGGGGDRLGDLSALASMAAYTAYYSASKKARTVLGTLEYQTALTLVAVVLLGAVTLVSGQDTAAPRGSSWIWVALMVALPGTGHLLTNFAHAHVRLVVLGILTLFSPVGSTFVAWLVLDESLGAVQVLGMGVVVASLAVIVAASARTTPDQANPAASATAR